ncbi:MAG: Uma2 family endonuclease [Bacteroidota bacterium]|nr:Uma2 family endonuclease [Bacteroidota bacterium]
MTQALARPPKTILEVWESLPEGTLCQLINNQLIMSPAPPNIHQVILNEINVEISLYLRKNKLGEVRIAPYDVHFSEQNILQPDLLFIENKNLDKVQKDGLYVAPDLIIEILSPSTAKLDYKEKKSVYEKFGVTEYFIVDPESKYVNSFFLRKGKYEEQKSIIGKINSKILGTNISF